VKEARRTSSSARATSRACRREAPEPDPGDARGDDDRLDRKKVEVKPADYYLFYFASSTCSPLPGLHAEVRRAVPEVARGPDGPRGRHAVEQRIGGGFARVREGEGDEPGRSCPSDDRKDALNAYHVTLQPGMVVVDRFGKILATNSPGYRRSRRSTRCSISSTGS
jgi:hypothetical protein